MANNIGNQAAEPGDHAIAVLVEMLLRVDGVNLVAKAYDINDKEITIPHRIVISPQFFTSTASIPLSSVVVKMQRGGREEEHSRVSLQLSGSDGRVRALALTKTVLPRFMDPDSRSRRPNKSGEEKPKKDLHPVG